MRDRASGLYLTASGWDYHDGAWRVRHAAWDTDLCQLSRSHDHALRVINGLSEYYRDRLDSELAELDSARAAFNSGGRAWYTANGLQSMERRIESLRIDSNRDPELLKVTVETNVSLDPV